MKNDCKTICGVLVGIMIGGATVVCANQAIQAMQNTEIKVSLNGQVQTFEDETTGETQYPITYNNRTYLPLRNVANIAGLKVDFDQSSNTALLTKTDNGVYDEKTGLMFSNMFIYQWHQVAGIDIYSYSMFKDGYKVSKVSVPLGEPNNMKEDFDVQYEYKEWSVNCNGVIGISGMYKTDPNDLENSPKLDCIVLRLEDGTYYKMDPNTGAKIVD